MYYVTTTLKGKRIMIPKESLIPRTAAYGLIIDGDKILLVSVKSTNKLWFPGGKIEDGETLESGLLRECEEEANLEIVIEKLFLETETTFYYEGTEQAFDQRASFYICHVSDKPDQKLGMNDFDDATEKPTWYSIVELKEEQFQDYGYQVLEQLSVAKNLKS